MGLSSNCCWEYTQVGPNSEMTVGNIPKGLDSGPGIVLINPSKGECESHAGHTFCCLAGLSLLAALLEGARLHKRNTERLAVLE